MAVPGGCSDTLSTWLGQAACPARVGLGGQQRGTWEQDRKSRPQACWPDATASSHARPFWRLLGRNWRRHNPQIDVVTTPVPRLYLSHGVLDSGDLAPRGRWQCPQTGQVVTTGQVCTPWASGAKARPGQRHGPGRTGRAVASEGDWARAEPLRMGGHRAPTLRPTRSPGPQPVHLDVGRRAACVGAVPALRRTRGVRAASPDLPWPPRLGAGTRVYSLPCSMLRGHVEAPARRPVTLGPLRELLGQLRPRTHAGAGPPGTAGT